MQTIDNVVIGAGPAGLAMMAALKHDNKTFVAFEAHDSVGGLWNLDHPESPSYPSLMTNSSRFTTYLDIKPDNVNGDYFSQQEAQQYLNQFSERHDLSDNIRFGYKVSEVKQCEDRAWEVFGECPDGTFAFKTNNLMVGSGAHSISNQMIPKEWSEALKERDIEFYHASHYKEKTQSSGKRIGVVGFGNSAVDIAIDLHKNGNHVALLARSSIWIIPLFVLGIPADLLRRFSVKFYIPFFVQRLFFLLLQKIYVGHPLKEKLGKPKHDILDRIPVVDRGIVDYVRRESIKVASINDKEELDQILDELDTVILATGYERSYTFLEQKYWHSIFQREEEFPFFVFHPKYHNLFFLTEVNVPQGGWSLFMDQANAITGYLNAKESLTENAQRFDADRRDYPADFKGSLFRDSDRFHVDPDQYSRALKHFSRWIQS